MFEILGSMINIIFILFYFGGGMNKIIIYGIQR